jgi:GT2 family glycosyltransferase
LQDRKELPVHVAVCIVGYRNCEDVDACLGALGKSIYEDFEVIICENGGASSYRALTDALPDQLPRRQTVRIIEAPRNLGYAGGVNVCLRASDRADAWWILNPDTLPDPAALQALVRRLTRGDCELVGGVLYGPDMHIQTLGGRWRPWLARAKAIGRVEALNKTIDAKLVERQIDFVSGASMLVGRPFLDAVGEMREDYFLYCEEVEWCLRGRAKGMRIGLAPDARVLHHQGSSTGSALVVRQRPRLQVYLDERNKILVTRDRYPCWTPVAVPAALLLIFLRYGGRGALRQLGYALRGWSAALVGKRGAPHAE